MSWARMDHATMTAIVDRCVPLVRGLPQTKPRTPVRVLQEEACRVAEVVEDFFEAREIDGRKLPGLRSLVSAGQLPADIAAELREMSTALGAVQSDLATQHTRQSREPLDRGAFILRELRAVLRFVLEDGENPEGARQLEQVREEFEGLGSHPALAAALEAFSSLAMHHEQKVIRVPGFVRTLLDEAVQVAAEVRQHTAERITGKPRREARELLALRNRLITGLTARLQTARRAVRYHFRDHPDVVRLVQSEYQRDKRRRARERRETDRGRTEEPKTRSSEVVPVSARSRDLLPASREMQAS